MADDNDSIINKKPNSLDRIGSEEQKRPSKSKIDDDALFEQRANMQTQEIRNIKRQLQEEQARYDRIKDAYFQVSSKEKDPTEALYRALGMPAAQAQATVRSQPIEQQYNILDKLQLDYTNKWAIRQDVIKKRLQEKQNEQAAIAARMFQQHVISRIAHPRAGVKAEMRDDLEAMQLAQEYASSRSPEIIKKSLARLQRSRERYGLETAEAAGRVLEPGGRERYEDINKRYEEQLRKERILEESGRISEKRSKDYKKLAAVAVKTMDDIAERRGEKIIKSGAKEGQFGSLKDIENALKSAEERFKEAGKAFISVMGQTGEASDKAADALKEAKDELDDWRMISKEAGGSGRGRKGGGGGIFNTIAGIGDIAGRGVDFLSYAAVGLQSEQMGMRIKAASMMNEKYNDLFAASQGDMAALRRVSQNEFAESAKYGSVYGGRAAGFGAAGAGVDLVTGAAAGAATLMTGAAPWSISGGLVVGNLISGAQKAARVGAGVTRAEAELNAAAQRRQLLDTVNAVPDTAKQAFFDYRMQTFRGMMGAGSRLSDLYGAATSRQTVENLSGLGITPAEQAALFSTGVKAIGPSFMRDPNAAAQTVTRAAEMEAAGVMSAQSYMQRVGQMTTLGGGQKDVEEILASAVTRGVNDAKSLEGIMELAQAISRDSATRGIGAITEVQRGLSFGLEQYKDLPIDESLKRGLVGYQQQDVVNRIKAGGSRLGFEAMSFIDTMTSKIPGMSSFEAGRLAGKDPREMEAVYRQYKDRLQSGKIVSDADIAALGDYAGLFVDRFGRGRGRAGLDIAKTAALTMPLDAMFAAGLIPSEEKAGVMKAIETGNMSGLSAQTKVRIGGLISGAAGISGQAYQIPTTPTPLQRPTGEAGAAQLADIAQATGQAGQVLQAQKMLGEYTPMSLISQVMTTAARTADVDQAGKDAAQAGEKMTIDTSKFDVSVTKFSDAVDKLSEAVRPLGMSGSYGSQPGSQRFDLAYYLMNRMVGVGGVPLSPKALGLKDS